MAISFKQLIQIAPFPEDRRKLLLENLDKMTEDQKYRLTNIAWKVLSQMYFARLNIERQRIMDEVVLKDRKINLNDFEEIEAKLLHEFAGKLESAESEAEIEEVRKQLEQYKSQPFAQDKTTSSPPSPPKS